MKEGCGVEPHGEIGEGAGVELGEGLEEGGVSCVFRGGYVVLIHAVIVLIVSAAAAAVLIVVIFIVEVAITIVE